MIMNGGYYALQEGKWKMTIKQCGVYKIANTITGDYYIGSSSDIVKRMRDHRCLLSNNAHYNPHLQNSWNKHGKNAFAFEIILLCDIENQLYYEQVCIDALKPTYNIATNASASAQGLTWGDETRRKLSEAKSGKNNPNFGKTLSDETRKKMSVAKSGENHPFFGKHHSDEAKHKMSEAKIGKPLSEEHKRKLSEANSGKTLSEEHKRKISEANFGKTFSEEHKQKMSESHSGDKHPRWINFSNDEIMEMQLLRVQGYSYEKIAETFCVSRDVVRKRLNLEQWR